MKKYIKPAMNVVMIETTSQVLTVSPMGIYDEGVDFGVMKSRRSNGFYDDYDDDYDF